MNYQEIARLYNRGKLTDLTKDQLEESKKTVQTEIETLQSQVEELGDRGRLLDELEQAEDVETAIYQTLAYR